VALIYAFALKAVEGFRGDGAIAPTEVAGQQPIAAA
jgi:hypothetical protein